MTIVVRTSRKTVVVPKPPVGSPGAKGDPGSPGEGYATRSAMAARLAPALFDDVYLTEAGREGKFVVDLASNWTAVIAADTLQGLLVASTADATKVYVRIVGNGVSPRWFGAKGDGTTNDGAAFVAAIAALKAYALNAGGGVYKGSPKLFIPAGHYYLGSTTLDVDHTLIIEGEGSGRAPAPGYGCTLLRWADGVCGLRTQTFNTSGTTTVDGPHDGAGSVYIRNLSLEGGYVATNGASHAIVVRAITFLDDVLIRGWSGTGVLTWIGIVNGTDYGGNADVSRFTGVKVQDCKVGFDTRGTNSNLITFLNCEAYQNRQAGFIDDNGAGSNTYIGCHAPYNGLTGLGITTQVTSSGKYYAVRWGQETGAATNAPSGTTDDNTWWAYVGAGSADSTHPAWVSGMSGLASGGDYVMLSNFPTLLSNCYSEGGGFSQLAVGTLAIAGTNLGLSSIGGTCLVPEFDGLALKRLHGAAIQHFDGASGSLNGFDSRDSAGTVGGALLISNQIAFLRAPSANGLFIQTISGGVITTQAIVDPSGLRVVLGQLGYGTGAGGTVAQATSRTTGVTLNKPSGAVTLFSAAGSVSWQTFTVTNSAVAATDVIRVVQKSGADKYMIHVTNVGAGSFDVTFATTGGTTTEQPVFNFAVIKAATS